MKFFRILLTALVLATVSFGASAGDILRFGPRVGVQLNSMHFNSDAFSSDNRAGFTGGLMLEANVPVIGLAFDLSAMYVHRQSTATFNSTDANDQALVGSDNFKKRDYIEIPLNIKYKIGLPVVGKIVSPYVFTGPSFAFLVSKKAISEAYENKSFDLSWNFGVGVQLFNHLQVGASYGLGLTNTVNKVVSTNMTPVESKQNCWTVTAAWLF